MVGNRSTSTKASIEVFGGDKSRFKMKLGETLGESLIALCYFEPSFSKVRVQRFLGHFLSLFGLGEVDFLSFLVIQLEATKRLICVPPLSGLHVDVPHGTQAPKACSFQLDAMHWAISWGRRFECGADSKKAAKHLVDTLIAKDGSGRASTQSRDMGLNRN